MGPEQEPDEGGTSFVEPETGQESAEISLQTPETKGGNWITSTKEGLKTVLGSIFSTKAEMTGRFFNAVTKINGLFVAGTVGYAISNPELKTDVRIAASSFVLLGLATFGVATLDTYTAKKKEAEREVANGTK